MVRPVKNHHHHSNEFLFRKASNAKKLINAAPLR
jgi:hypothetical protein